MTTASRALNLVLISLKEMISMLLMISKVCLKSYISNQNAIDLQITIIQYKTRFWSVYKNAILIVLQNAII